MNKDGTLLCVHVALETGKVLQKTVEPIQGRKESAGTHWMHHREDSDSVGFSH